MGKKDPRIDAYIAKAAPFAQPILKKLRLLVHRAAPEIRETVKWGMPFFEREGIVCHMAAFKEHCAFGFWHGGKLGLKGKEKEAMGQFGRIAARQDLPDDATLVALVEKAVELDGQGIKKKKPAPGRRPPIPMPPVFRAALAATPAAQATFEGFPPSHRYDYLEWITEAKTEPTRDRRIATAIEWLAEGKPRHWKYRR